MRRLFERAWEKAQAVKDHDDWDNGSHGSDFMYHGSDQSIFNTIFGEQEYQREVMRRRHLSLSDKAQGRAKSKATYLEGTLITDPLSPSFTHEPGVAKEGKPDEFGIGLDYFSDLGQQTINTDEDTHYLTYNQDINEQLKDRAKDRNDFFDCKNRVDGDLPQDVLNSRPPLTALDQQSSWNGVSLFSNLCLNTVPVMIHHNGNKDARHWQWTDLWIQPHAREMMEAVRRQSDGSSTTVDGLEVATGGAHLPDGGRLSWDQLCPAEYEWTLFRDVPKPEGWP